MPPAHPDSLAEELSVALAALDLGCAQVTHKPQVLAAIARTFVNGHPRAWWLGLRGPVRAQSFADDSGYRHLQDVAPQVGGNVWWVVDDGEQEPFVFDIPLARVGEVIAECRYVEYYLVAKTLDWLLAENDHGQLLLATQGAIEQSLAHPQPVETLWALMLELHGLGLNKAELIHALQRLNQHLHLDGREQQAASVEAVLGRLASLD